MVIFISFSENFSHLYTIQCSAASTICRTSQPVIYTGIIMCIYANLQRVSNFPISKESSAGSDGMRMRIWEWGW